MSILRLDQEHIKWNEFNMSYTVDREVIRSQSGRIRFSNTGGARRVIRGTCVALTGPIRTTSSKGLGNENINQTSSSPDRDFIRGTIQAAYYNGSSIEFQLPPEAFNYTGSLGLARQTANSPVLVEGSDAEDDVQVALAAVAGSNTIRLREGAGPATSTASAFPQGTFIQFGSNTTNNTHSQIYTVNQYFATTQSDPVTGTTRTAGDIVVHPELRSDIDVGTEVRYASIFFRGKITSLNIEETYLAGNNDYLSIDLVIEEDL
jgi:hypothetical protein